MVNQEGETSKPTVLGNVSDGVKDTDAVNVKQLNDLTISYQTNNSQTNTTTLKKGFNFTSNDLNIYDEDKGKVEFRIKDELKNLFLGKGNDGRDGKDGSEVLNKSSDNSGSSNAGSHGLTNKDGLNGKDLIRKANALRNGESGVVVYTDDAGNRVVKANNGKYYKQEFVNEDGNLKTDKEVQPGKIISEVKDIQARIVDSTGETTMPIVFTNVKSALIKEDDTYDNKDKVIKRLNDGTKINLNAAATLNDLHYISNTGLNFTGDTGNPINRKLGDTLTIKGSDKNIQVNSSGNDLKIKLSEDLNDLNSITFKDNKGKIKGLDNIKETDGSDIAVNKGYVDNKLGYVGKKVDMAIENSNLALGGVANAVAMANLVQVTGNSTHRHNLSAAYGYYGGSHALAIGFSGISKDNKFIYKLSGSVNNQGNLAFGVGAGIMLGEKNDYKERKDTALLVKELAKANKIISEYKKNQEETNNRIKYLEHKLELFINGQK